MGNDKIPAGKRAPSAASRSSNSAGVGGTHPLRKYGGTDPSSCRRTSTART